jgi:hypothetical protein
MASRRAQEPPTYERTLEYPIDAEGSGDYLLRSIPRDTLEEFDARCQTAGKSRRWTLLTLMRMYGEGKIRIT